MVECSCQFAKRNEKGEVIERGCYKRAVKRCRHGFYSCDKHKHGCNHEEEFPLVEVLE